MATKTPPNYVESHNLLGEKVVVVTAAAGTGIGSAVARRCIEEGAVSYTHLTLPTNREV